MYLIILIKKHSNGILTTSIKWGKFKYTWFGKKSVYYATRFCNSWFGVAKKTRIVYKNKEDQKWRPDTGAEKNTSIYSKC
jgi:hypothetical protein